MIIAKTVGICEKCHVKNKLHELGYFVARDWPYQLVEWQICEFYLLTDCKFQFHVTTQPAVKSMYLILKYSFLEGKIKEIIIPKTCTKNYFLGCCFESDKKEITTPERLGCRGKHKFDERSFKKNNDVEKCYCLNRI